MSMPEMAAKDVGTVLSIITLIVLLTAKQKMGL